MDQELQQHLEEMMALAGERVEAVKNARTHNIYMSTDCLVKYVKAVALLDIAISLSQIRDKYLSTRTTK
jgi:hypothetical protein